MTSGCWESTDWYIVILGLLSISSDCNSARDGLLSWSSDWRNVRGGSEASFTFSIVSSCSCIPTFSSKDTECLRRLSLKQIIFRIKSNRNGDNQNMNRNQAFKSWLLFLIICSYSFTDICKIVPMKINYTIFRLFNRKLCIFYKFYIMCMLLSKIRN